MKTILTLAFFVIIGNAAMPCGNEYGYTLEGARRETQYFYLHERITRFDSTDLAKRMKKLGELVQNGTATYKTWSDIALNLMKLGKADSSVKILRPLAAERPNEYNLIANLGTAYELTGELDSALKYISRDLVINPNSHFGSEWIHVKILEAKIKARKNPKWFDYADHRIINIDSIINLPDTTKRKEMIYKLYRDLSYQIRTRAPFTPPPDKVLTNLLISLGEFCARAETYENALLAYAYALRYLDPPYHKGQIESSIRKLNFKRDSLPGAHELPEMFLDMMKRSKISPSILLLGIDTYANTLDSLDNIKYLNQDSIQLLKAELDSLKGASEQPTERGTAASAESVKYLFLIAGLVLGAGGIWMLKRKNKNSTGSS